MRRDVVPFRVHRVHKIRPVGAPLYSRLRADSEVEVNKTNQEVSVWSNSERPHDRDNAPARGRHTVPIEASVTSAISRQLSSCNSRSTSGFE
jgi:hypothetical protein